MAFLADQLKRIKPSATIAVTDKARALKLAGRNVIGLGAGEPDFDTPDNIKKAAIKAIESGKASKYTNVDGIAELKDAIVKKFKRENGLDYKPSQVTVGTGGKQVLYNAFIATLNPDDEVIIPAPYWVSYPDMVRLAGAEPVIVPTSERNAWKMSAEDFENAMTPRTKMLVLNSPCNPTGSVYTREEMQAIVDVATEEDIYILSDEIYEKLVYDDVKHVSIASLSKEAYDLTITVNGFSKSYAMTGWRLGYLAAPEAVAKAVDSIQSHTTANPSSFSQRGALAALKGDQQPLADMREEFDMRRNYMFDRISKIPNITAIKPQGAFYILVNISQLGLSSQNFADRLLSKSSVAVVPGAAFGDDRTVRLSYATSIDIIKKGLDRFQDFCRTL
jgi:aspartate aminotransferase